MRHYDWIQTFSDGIEILTGFPHGTQMWAECTIRKDKQCVLCGCDLKKEKAYRPITNRGNRMERICLECIQKMIERGSK